MAKSLRSITNDVERKQVISRRLQGKEKGLGYWGAVDAEKREQEKKGKPVVGLTPRDVIKAVIGE